MDAANGELKPLKRLSAVLLVAVLAHGVWDFAVHCAGPLRSPWSRDYGEGTVLAEAQLLAHGRSYFVDLRDYPYLLGNYPPVFIGLTALTHRALGPSLWAPRLLALLFTLGTLAVVFVTLRRLLEHSWMALASTLVVVTPWFVTTWAALARVDTAAIFFSVVTLAVVALRGCSQSAWPALPSSWLAFFTKHNALLAPVAVLLDLAVGRDRRLPRVLLLWLAPMLSLLALLVWATGGYAWRHLVTWTALADYEWDRMAASYLHFVLIAGPMLALLAGALLTARRALFAGAGRLVFLYFLLNAAAFATIAKAGAAQNYFIEPWIATVLLAALSLRALVERFARLRPWWPALLLACALVPSYAFPSLDRMPAALRRPGNARDFVALERLVRETRGPILSENMSILVVNDRPVLFDAWGMEMLARKGIFHPERLVRDCQEGRFSLVVVEYRLNRIPGLGECLESRYRLLADLGAYAVLEPRP